MERSPRRRQGLIVTGALLIALGVGRLIEHQTGFFSRFPNVLPLLRPNTPGLVYVVATPTPDTLFSVATAVIKTQTPPTPTAIPCSEIHFSQPIPLDKTSAQTLGFVHEPGYAVYLEDGTIKYISQKEAENVNPKLLAIAFSRGQIYTNVGEKPVIIAQTQIPNGNRFAYEFPQSVKNFIVAPGQRIYAGPLYRSGPASIDNVYVAKLSTYVVTATVNGSQINPIIIPDGCLVNNQ